MKSKFFVLTFFLLFASFSNGDEKDRNYKRQVQLSKFLTISAKALDGKERRIEPKLDVLWNEARSQHAMLHGKSQSVKKLTGKNQTLQELEPVVFDLMETLWGQKWIDEFLPQPEANKGLSMGWNSRFGEK